MLDTLHGELYTFLGEVYADDLYLDYVADAHHVKRVLYEFVGHL